MGLLDGRRLHWSEMDGTRLVFGLFALALGIVGMFWLLAAIFH
jgi:hypothetical protein